MGPEKMTELTIGVDISKDHLDAACHTSGRQARFPYDASGLRALRGWIGPVQRVARLVYEATGRYHADLEDAFEGWPLVKVNPGRARRFAEACGTHAKTDAVAQNARFQHDARMLARMGAQLELVPDLPVSPEMRALRRLHSAREGLVRDRISLMQREKQARLPLLRRLSATALRLAERQLAEVEAAIRDAIAADPALARRNAVLTSIPGVGPHLSATLVTEMPELGTASDKEIAALAGVAPMTRQSGRWSGKAWVTGGRSHVRRALFMPALNASQHNPDLRRTYERLLAAGRAPKVAITAVMRKLIILANTLLAENLLWAPRTA